MGAIILTFVCLPVVIGAALLPFQEVMGEAPTDTPLWLRSLLYPAGVANVWLLWQVWRHIRNKWHPVALRVARSLPRLNMILRWFVAALWLCHFAVCILGCFVPFHMNFSTFEDGFASVLTPLIWSVAIAYAANLFLLLTLFAFTLKESVLNFLWRHRWSVDLAITGSCATISVLLK